MTDPRIIPPRQLTEILDVCTRSPHSNNWSSLAVSQLVSHAAAQRERIAELERQADASEAENVRLLELFALVPHEDLCPQRGLIACHNAAGDECEWLFSGCTTHSKEKFACDCIKSKVTL